MIPLVVWYLAGNVRNCDVVVVYLDMLSYIRHEDFLRPPCVTFVLPPLDSVMGRTGELWSNRVVLILEN